MSKIIPKECQNVEFKRIWKDEYLKWICGFANAQGAVMYFGVDDDHEVVGLKDSKRLLEDIPSKVVNYMGLVVDVNLYERDGLDYIELVVEPSNVAISNKGKYYYRSGSTMQELNGVALQQFLLKKMGRSWDDITNERATLEDIDRNAIDYFLKKGIEAQRIPESERDASTKDVLESLGLLDDNGNLKNAAVLLFGKNPQKFFPSAVFKIGRFGKDEADLMFQDVIEGNIIQMADRVMKLYKLNTLYHPYALKECSVMRHWRYLRKPCEKYYTMLWHIRTTQGQIFRCTYIMTTSKSGTRENCLADMTRLCCMANILLSRETETSLVLCSRQASSTHGDVASRKSVKGLRRLVCPCPRWRISAVAYR